MWPLWQVIESTTFCSRKCYTHWASIVRQKHFFQVHRNLHVANKLKYHCTLEFLLQMFAGIKDDSLQSHRKYPAFIKQFIKYLPECSAYSSQCEKRMKESTPWHNFGVQQLESLLGTQKFYAINKTARHECWQPAHNNALSLRRHYTQTLNQPKMTKCIIVTSQHLFHAKRFSCTENCK